MRQIKFPTIFGFKKAKHRHEVSLGRVIAVKRHQGLGTKIVEHAIAFAKEHLGAGEIVIEAQTYVRGLYEKLGFRAESEEFLEDGIPHVRMRLLLKKRLC